MKLIPRQPSGQLLLGLTLKERLGAVRTHGTDLLPHFRTKNGYYVL